MPDLNKKFRSPQPVFTDQLFKAHIPLETGFGLGTQHKQNGHKQHEMYMPNTNPNLAYPTRTIFHRLALGPPNLALCPNAWGWVYQAWRWLFGYQHVGISNAKSRWFRPPTRRPNVSSFALQWNIGLTLFYM